jgi:Ni/Co efflux regulator RcnB
MKRLVLAAVALSFLASPMVSAQAAPMVLPAVAAPSSSVLHVDWKQPSKQYDRRHVDRRVVKKQVVRKQQWKRGQRYSDWRRHQPVRDYSRHGLKRPGHGQQWIKVGNEYLLISVASGLIGAMIAGR